jgi:hypothetical protein
MKTTGEWGEFFPIKESIYAYNESIAHEFTPLQKEAITKKGWPWIETKQEPTINYKGPKREIPLNIQTTSKDICERILTCSESDKLYKIIPQEYEFYKNHSIPIPRVCHDQRHLKRFQKRLPRVLWNRNCDHCKTEIQTAYAPERSEKVYCEQCYLEAII